MAVGTVTVTLTIKASAAFVYAGEVAAIVDELLDLIPDWQNYERDGLTERLNISVEKLLNSITQER